MELNPQQEKAVKHGDGPLLIVAGAGSGKTRTLTSRLLHIVEQGARPDEIVAITFTNKAAEEMRSRIAHGKSHMANRGDSRFAFSDSPFIGTFHSFGARILRHEARIMGRTRFFTIFDEDDSLSLMKKVFKGVNAPAKVTPPGMLGRVSRAKSELFDPNEFFDSREQELYRAYESALTKNNAFDFDDLIEKVVRLFRERPDVLRQYRNRFRYVLVDEFQDVNAAQYELVRQLAGEHRNVSVVGDDAQAIYGWRWANFRNFLRFEDDWPGTKVVLLEQNYRSAANIITAASALITNNIHQKPKELWTENPAGGRIRVVKAENGEEEAEWIADQLMSYGRATVGQLNSSPAGRTNSSTHQLINSSTAVLYRTNAQSRPIEQALIAADIPYRIFGGIRFYARREVKDVVAALRVAANPADTVSRERIEKTFRRAVADELLAALPALAKEKSLLEIIGFFLKKTDYFEYLNREFLNADERRENVEALIAYAGEFPNLHDFLERVTLLQSADTPANRNPASPISNLPSPIAVNLMTIHLAKGLEFDRVFIAGASEGTLPHHMAYDSSDELEEERRLMYVAMTRAKQELAISFTSMPSRFLYELPPELVEFTDLSGESEELPDEDEIYSD